MGFKKSEIQRFCCKNMSLRRYGSFNGFIELHHLELLRSAKNFKIKQCYFTLELTKTACTCIQTSPAGVSIFTCTKTKETRLKMAILGGDTHLFFFSVRLFHFVSGSFQALFTKSMYSGPTIPFFSL